MLATRNFSSKYDAQGKYLRPSSALYTDHDRQYFYIPSRWILHPPCLCPRTRPNNTTTTTTKPVSVQQNPVRSFVLHSRHIYTYIEDLFICLYISALFSKGCFVTRSRRICVTCIPFRAFAVKIYKKILRNILLAKAIAERSIRRHLLLVHRNKLEVLLCFFFLFLRHASGGRRSEAESKIQESRHIQRVDDRYVTRRFPENHRRRAASRLIRRLSGKQSHFILARSVHRLSWHDVHPPFPTTNSCISYIYIYIVDAHGSHVISCKDRGTLPRKPGPCAVWLKSDSRQREREREEELNSLSLSLSLSKSEILSQNISLRYGGESRRLCLPRRRRNSG